MKALLTTLFLAASPVTACEIALVLAVDVSGSVSWREYRIQMDGLAAALSEPVIADALAGSNAQVSLLQWTGEGRQSVVIDWTGIDTFADALGFAQRVAEADRAWNMYSTAIGEALIRASDHFAAVPDCARRVIDVSGDGPSNEGMPLAETRARLARDGIVVNAIVIEESLIGLTEYFRREVIFGKDAFAVTASTFDDYPREILRKLERELTEQLSLND